MAGKQWQLAKESYRQLLEVQRNNTLTLNNAAWLMVQQGKPGAVAVAERPNSLLPERALLMDTLAVVLDAECQMPRAISVHSAVVKLSDGNPAARLDLARICLKADEKSKAHIELEALKKLGDQFADQAKVAKLLKSLWEAVLALAGRCGQVGSLRAQWCRHRTPFRTSWRWCTAQTRRRGSMLVRPCRQSAGSARRWLASLFITASCNRA